MPFPSINKLLVDHNGGVWALPRLSNISSSRIGICVLKNDEWTLYNSSNVSSIGTIGDGVEHRGFVESRHPQAGEKEWSIWIGTNGGQVKRVQPEINDWSQFCIFVQHAGDGRFYHTGPDCPDPGWAKCDAMVQDSSGYIWMSVWRNPAKPLSNGALLCYDDLYEPDPGQHDDPLKAHYRRFFKTGDPAHDDNYRCMIVDVLGNIIAGGENGKISILSHNGNPLKDGVTVKIIEETDGKVLDMVTTADGITRIATLKGIYIYNGYENELKISEDELGAGITCMEAEDQSVLWLGIPGEGLVRYDLSNGEQKVFTTAQGLLSTQIQDLEIDRKNGYIWVATDLGISRLSIGYKISENNSKSTVMVYPNPFIRSRHSEIYFKNIPSNGSVEIFNTDGRLVDRASLVRKGDLGAFFTWKPNSKLISGTYFYTIRSTGFSKIGKVLITP
jgi:hypothetical protein